jgi:hypothetical protein
MKSGVAHASLRYRGGIDLGPSDGMFAVKEGRGAVGRWFSRPGDYFSRSFTLYVNECGKSSAIMYVSHQYS